MTLRYTLTNEDYLQFNLFHHQHDPSLRRLYRMLRLLFPALLFLLLLIRRPQPMGLFACIFGVFALLWVLVYPPMHRRSIRWAVNRQFPKNRPHEFIGPQVLSLNEDHIRCERTGRVSETAYSTLLRLARTPQALYVYDTRLSAFIIPLSSAESPAHVEALLQLLRDKTGLQVEQFD